MSGEKKNDRISIGPSFLLRRSTVLPPEKIARRIDDYVSFEAELEKIFESKNPFVSGSILNISNCELSYLPDSIETLSSSLESLNVSRNNLSSLPKTIGNLRVLKWLTLHRNLLSSVPDSICWLSSLVTLDLSRNKLSSVPEDIGNLSSLRKLDLSANKISSLPDSICRLYSIMTLDLSRNDLSSIPENIGNLSSLKKLNLAANKLSYHPDSIGRLYLLENLIIDDIGDDSKDLIRAVRLGERCRTCKLFRWRVPFRGDGCVECRWQETKLVILGSRDTEGSPLSWLPPEMISRVLSFL